MTSNFTHCLHKFRLNIQKLKFCKIEKVNAFSVSLERDKSKRIARIHFAESSGRRDQKIFRNKFYLPKNSV